MEQEVPIPTVHLIAEIDLMLIGLLGALSPEDWLKPTWASAWSVKDVVAHLLDGNIRGLSTGRDQYTGSPTPNIDGYTDLVAYLNGLNVSWVEAMKRASTTVLIDLLDHTNQQYQTHLASLDPFASAIFSVAWAGETTSENWFHIAREYTEKWHHQQQIREATGHPDPLLEPRYYIPYLETCMRAFPYHLRDSGGQPGDYITLTITDTGVWYVVKNTVGWAVGRNKGIRMVCSLDIQRDVAWRIFSGQIRGPELIRYIRQDGNPVLANHLLQARAFMV